MESQRSAQERLDALERDRQRVRARLLLPWWHHVGWGVTWCVFTVSTVLMTDSGWIFLVYGFTYLAFFALWRARVRMQGLQLTPPPAPAWKGHLYLVGGAALMVGLILLVKAFDSPWPLVVGNIALGILIVLASMRDERRQVMTLRDER